MNPENVFKEGEGCEHLKKCSSRIEDPDEFYDLQRKCGTCVKDYCPEREMQEEAREVGICD
ncbi:MAG: hypothetical protein ABIE22_00685 [archaeon]